jgi:hypothetical protein
VNFLFRIIILITGELEPRPDLCNQDKGIMEEASPRCCINEDFTVTYKDQDFEELFGHTIGNSFIDNVWENEKEVVTQILTKVFCTKKDTQFSCRYYGGMCSGSGLHLVSWNTIYYKKKIIMKGKITTSKIFGLLEENEFYNCIDLLPLLVTCIDTQGNILWVNTKELPYMGYQKDQFIGKKLNK